MVKWIYALCGLCVGILVGLIAFEIANRDRLAGARAAERIDATGNEGKSVSFMRSAEFDKSLDAVLASGDVGQVREFTDGLVADFTSQADRERHVHSGHSALLGRPRVNSVFPCTLSRMHAVFKHAGISDVVDSDTNGDGMSLKYSAGNNTFVAVHGDGGQVAKVLVTTIAKRNTPITPTIDKALLAVAFALGDHEWFHRWFDSALDHMHTAFGVIGASDKMRVCIEVFAPNKDEMLLAIAFAPPMLKPWETTTAAEPSAPSNPHTGEPR